MIKDKLTENIGETLNGRDSTEMTFTKGLELPQNQNFHSTLTQN